MSVATEPAATATNRLPKYAEPEDVEAAQASGKGSKSCDRLRYELKTCLLDTQCCQNGRMPIDCLRSRDPSVPEECFKLSYQFFECKRSLLDMRTRFRGRKYDN